LVAPPWAVTGPGGPLVGAFVAAVLMTFGTFMTLGALMPLGAAVTLKARLARLIAIRPVAVPLIARLVPARLVIPILMFTIVLFTILAAALRPPLGAECLPWPRPGFAGIDVAFAHAALVPRGGRLGNLWHLPARQVPGHIVAG
jgi:hypothetical protein